MADVAERFGRFEEQIGLAVTAIESDSGASPVLVAVVREFQGKAVKAKSALNGEERAVRDAVLEVEQAGDSAKAAAEADPGVGDAAKQAVLDAHLSICILKSKL